MLRHTAGGSVNCLAPCGKELDNQHLSKPQMCVLAGTMSCIPQNHSFIFVANRTQLLGWPWAKHRAMDLCIDYSFLINTCWQLGTVLCWEDTNERHQSRASWQPPRLLATVLKQRVMVVFWCALQIVTDKIIFYLNWGFREETECCCNRKCNGAQTRIGTDRLENVSPPS